MRPRRCIECREDAIPGKSRCRNHGGAAWARQPAARQAAYRDPTYQRNRKIVLARDPICRLRLPGCTGRSTTVDHIVSVARGGDSSLENLLGACHSCNLRRGGAEGRATMKKRAASRRLPDVNRKQQP